MNEMFALAPWLETLRDTSAVIVAMAGAVVAVSAAAKVPFISRPVHWIGRTLFAQPVERWLTRFLNEHQAPIHETIKATADQVKDLDGRLESIEHEVLPNDGSSLRDAVTRTETKCSALDTELRQLILSFTAPQPRT